MHEALRFSPADRVLVVAPHPDDESIAAGGLIQAALAAGAGVRVLVLTDGDANVWPQRWIEKRWRIDATARARWGARRRAEAVAALSVLGLPIEAAVFLGLPDLGLTNLLMRTDATVVAALRAQLREFAPGMLVLPSLSDRHPDHSAAHILMRLALDDRAFAFPRLLEFAVHGKSMSIGDQQCELDADMRARKREAIRAHATQMRLSGTRFLRYAGDREIFVETGRVAAIHPANPLRARRDGDGWLCVRLPGAASLRGMALFVVFDDGTVQRRWCLRQCNGARRWYGHDTVAGQPLADLSPAVADGALRLRLPGQGWRMGFVKLARPQPGLWVFDQHGWQVIESG